MRVRWNRTLCEELLLPLLPSALANAVDGVGERAVRRLLEAVIGSEMVKNRLEFVTRRHWLLPVVATDGVRWRALDANARPVLSIPKWSQAPEAVRRQFVDPCSQRTGDDVFIDDAVPRFAGDLDDWTVDPLERLLNCIPGDVFGSLQSLHWIKGVVFHVIGQDARDGDIRAAAVARWLAGKIGDGALAHTTRRSVSRESRDELREAWRDLCHGLPKAWLVETPVESQQAVVELAAEEMIGEGLFPLPFGRRPEGSPTAPQLDQERLDRALLTLGRRLEVEGESEPLRHSRLVLAETLLSRRRHNHPMVQHLVKVPLLRAVRLPEDREEAWSIVELRRQIENRRVFASPASEFTDSNGTDRIRPERLADPKQAVMELAKALDEAAWFVSGDVVGSIADAPSPTPEALAAAVLRAERFAEPAHRTRLLNRLAPNITDNDSVRLAARALLAGRAVDVVGQDTELFHGDDDNARALAILLRLMDQSWRTVQGRWVDTISQDLANALSVSRADLKVLHRILGDCLCLEQPVDWTVLGNEEALLLLRSLYSPEPEDRRRWQRMPLHRGVDGSRGAFDQLARRSTGATDEFPLPPELAAEVRILDPYPQLAHLYESLPVMDRDGVLRLMLEDSRPWRFARQIVQAVCPADGQMTLPQVRVLRGLLRDGCWLPRRDGGGLAPDAVLVAPQAVLDAIADLAAAGALKDKRLPDIVEREIWRVAEPVVREALGRPNRNIQVRRMVDALDSDKVAQVDDGAWLVLPQPELVTVPLLECALETTLSSSHRGWKLVHFVKNVLRHGDGGLGDDSELLLRLAKALCAPIPPNRQIQMLTGLADKRPPKGSSDGRMFLTLLGCFAKTENFFTHVLPKIHLPTQDGNWHESRDVARSETGIARRHRLVSELRPILQLTGDDRSPGPELIQPGWGGYGLDTLEKYFEPWRGRLQPAAVGAFLSLLGSGLHGTIATLAEQWLGEDVSIDAIRSEFVGPSGQDPCADISVFVRPQVAHSDRVSAVNVLGSQLEMEAEPDDDTLFAIDPIRYPRSQYMLKPLGPFWEITLRDVEPQNRSTSELLHLLGGTVERWACGYLKLDREQVNRWWSRWSTTSQANLAPVLASIKAHLPLTLQQLDVKDNEPLRDALRKAEQAQRKREQAQPINLVKLKIEREALDHLASLVEAPEHRTFLWKRVNEMMRRYGYGRDSVLLELVQNADDALAEAAEINGGPLPLATRRLFVRIHEHGGVPTVDIMHWGRPINDSGGAVFPAGRERQWDQDLYFMMLMNLSGKPGEAPGESSSSSTTGRFGLGFKSVHLVSSSPSVVSGFIAFSIAGGLLPQEQAVADNVDSWMVEGRRATRVRLPLRSDVEAHTLISEMFGRFACARVLLPVFARQVQEVVVEGGPFPGTHVFDGKQIDGAPGWSIGAETDFPNHPGRWRVLRFRPADAGRDNMGTTALAIGLRDGVPTAFNPDVPFLWNVTPTSESWGCGYVVNGPFKLDPGRTHVSLDDDTTLRAVSDLGEALGEGLLNLHEVLADTRQAAYEPNGPMIGVDGRSFLPSLWKALVSGTATSDKLRRMFLCRLHGNGRGLSAWMAARGVVPTGLPAPFSPLLPPLNSGMSWKVAVDGLDNPELCAALAEVDDEDFARLLESHLVVSEETERLLLPLRNFPGMDDHIRSTPLRPCDLLAELARRWDYRLTPARLHAIRPLSQDPAWNLMSNDPHGAAWRGKIQAQAADGSLQPLRRLLLREVSVLRDDADGDHWEEFLRSAFAPDARVLDPAYIECREDWSVFRWFRMQHRVDAAEIAKWYMDLETGLRPAAVRYLLDGELQERVLPYLVPLNARPPWLRHYEDVRGMLGDLCEEPWRRQRLLGALFPDRSQVPEEPPAPVGLDSQAFYRQLVEWWDDATERKAVIAAYEKHVWPEWLRRDGLAGRLQADSEDDWLALLVLGACRSLGRTNDDQHRNFLELAHRKGWWGVFRAPDDADAWMGVLRDWHDTALAKLTYPHWMSLFPAIYQLSRYRAVYVRLLKSAGRRPESISSVTHLLAPRVDEALTGAGTHFDAPPAPLNMGLHWVLRELVRLEVVTGEHLFPYCWVPSEQVLDFLRPLGLRSEESLSNPEKARAIFNFLASKLGTETPNLHCAFDIPLRHVALNAELRRRFGLEQ